MRLLTGKTFKIIMKFSLFFLFANFFLIENFAQSTSVISKTCGNCGKSVSVHSKIGQRCPHCGFIWGSENSITRNSTNAYNLNRAGVHSKKSTKSKNQSVTGKQKLVRDESTASQADTEAWILDKLRKHQRMYSDNESEGFNRQKHDYIFNEFDFDKNYLVIKYKFHAYEGVDLLGGNYEDCMVKIPVADIRINWIDLEEDSFMKKVNGMTNSFYFMTNKNTIIKECGNNAGASDKFVVGLQYDAETDLYIRLNKAFLHLKEFYKMTVNKETF